MNCSYFTYATRCDRRTKSHHATQGSGCLKKIDTTNPGAYENGAPPPLLYAPEHAVLCRLRLPNTSPGRPGPAAWGHLGQGGLGPRMCLQASDFNLWRRGIRTEDKSQTTEPFVQRIATTNCNELLQLIKHRI